MLSLITFILPSLLSTTLFYKLIIATAQEKFRFLRPFFVFNIFKQVLVLLKPGEKLFRVSIQTYFK